MNKSLRFIAAAYSVLMFGFGSASAQKSLVQGNVLNDLRELVETSAVPGYEQQVAARIAEKLKGFSPKVDTQSNVVVTIGTGSPHRLIVASMDEPGYVVSGITPDGYLTLQRVPQAGSLPLFNELHSAQPRRRTNGSMAQSPVSPSICSRNASIHPALLIWTTCLSTWAPQPLPKRALAEPMFSAL